MSSRELLLALHAVQRGLIGPNELAELMTGVPADSLADRLRERLGEAVWSGLQQEHPPTMPAAPPLLPTARDSPPTEPARSTPPAAAAPGSGAGRYSILFEHARGGLGVVYLASDRELGRTVALKEIQEQHANDPGSRARFLFEAEVTGRLEHPGIVPVYGLGCHADGRPYYAMRFIQGESMHAAIRRFHAADGKPRDATERALALRGLLKRFIDACNAVAFAHGKGIIHRDLKPSNVMLGEYGETLVVDWGL